MSGADTLSPVNACGATEVNRSTMTCPSSSSVTSFDPWPPSQVQSHDPSQNDRSSIGEA